LWWLLIVTLALNWVIATVFLRPSHPTDVPYSFFRTQVQAGNVQQVTAVDDAIDGTFKKPVAEPAPATENGGRPGARLTKFSTHRPTFASDDKLYELLATKNVVVSAKPSPGPSLLERVLLGFGPTCAVGSTATAALSSAPNEDAEPNPPGSYRDVGEHGPSGVSGSPLGSAWPWRLVSGSRWELPHDAGLRTTRPGGIPLAGRCL
jgi:hypothetical protein